MALLELLPPLPLSRERCDIEVVTAIELEQLKRALSGDGRAFSDLVAPHLPLLFRLAERVSGDRALAEDAVQETLARAFTMLHRLDPATPLRALLAGIAARRAHTLLRAERRRRLREPDGLATDAPPGPGELLDAERARAKIRAALAAMPKKRREAALLRFDAGLSHKEIALALETTVESVRVLVHLARRDLRRHLASEMGTEELEP
ncbi:MAG TPA: sigma-70 family RNA polymerase sigma factor [Polyangiaceae bacterium]